MSSDLGRRVALGVGVAALVVVAAVVAGSVASPPTGIPPESEYPEYSSDRLAVDRLEDTGIPDPDGEVGTVVFDRSETNRFQREDVAPLADAITRAGGDVRFTKTHNGLDTTLSDADVLVVIDPASRYDQDDLKFLDRFLDNGGKVVIFGEPNRKVLKQTRFGLGLSTERSELTTLGSRLGISFGAQYLYDQQRNDGNFKNVLAGPPADQDHDLVEGVEDVAMYTATPVSAEDGEVLLRTAPTARKDGAARDEGYPVAVLNDRENVLAVGDKTFLQPQYASVGDNDVFISRIVEFMTDADHQPPEDEGENATVAALDGGFARPASDGSLRTTLTGDSTAGLAGSWAVPARDGAASLDAGTFARPQDRAAAASRIVAAVARSDPAG